MDLQIPAMAKLDERASHSYRDRFRRVEFLVFCCEIRLDVLGEREWRTCYCSRWWCFSLWRSRSVLQCGFLSNFTCQLPACPLRSCGLRSFCHCLPPCSRSTWECSFLTLANKPHRRLRLALSLDFQLCLGFCCQQLANSDYRRTRSLRRLGPQRQQL